jgi:hypothetical protein
MSRDGFRCCSITVLPAQTFPTAAQLRLQDYAHQLRVHVPNHFMLIVSASNQTPHAMLQASKADTAITCHQIIKADVVIGEDMQQQKQMHVMKVTSATLTQATSMVLLYQVWIMIAQPLQIGKSAFYQAAHDLERQGSSTMLCTVINNYVDLMRQLKSLGAISKKVGGNAQVKIISAGFLSKLLLKLRISSQLVESIVGQIKAARPPPSVTQQPMAPAVEPLAPAPTPSPESPSHAPHPHAAPSTNPVVPELGSSLPVVMPIISDDDDARLGSSFGLSTCNPGHRGGFLASGTPLYIKLRNFYMWCTCMAILDRPFKAITNTDGLEHSMTYFFGFVHNMFAIPVAQMDMTMCADASKVAALMALMIKRGLSATYMEQVLDSLSKAVEYMMAMERRAGHQAKTAHNAVVAWLKGPMFKLANRLGKATKLVDLTKMPSLHELVQRQEQYVQRAMAHYKTACTCQAVKLVHSLDMMKAALLSCMYGHMSPLRISCLITCKHPRYANTPCKGFACNKAGCCGNRLVKQADGTYEFDLPHHKTEQAGHAGQDPIVFKLPSTLHPIMAFYTEIVWPHMVNTQLGGLAVGSLHYASNVHHLFFSHKTKMPLDFAAVNKLFKEMLFEMGVPDNKHFPPRNLRHVWVSTMKDGDLEGQSLPNLYGQAAIMGHSHLQWDGQTYNRAMKRARMDKAVEAMPATRQALLSTNSHVAHAGAAAAAATAVGTAQLQATSKAPAAAQLPIKQDGARVASVQPVQQTVQPQQSQPQLQPVQSVQQSLQQVGQQAMQQQMQQSVKQAVQQSVQPQQSQPQLSQQQQSQPKLQSVQSVQQSVQQVGQQLQPVQSVQQAGQQSLQQVGQQAMQQQMQQSVKQAVQQSVQQAMQPQQSQPKLQSVQSVQQSVQQVGQQAVQQQTLQAVQQVGQQAVQQAVQPQPLQQTQHVYKHVRISSVQQQATGTLQQARDGLAALFSQARRQCDDAAHQPSGTEVIDLSMDDDEVTSIMAQRKRRAQVKWRSSDSL